MMLPLILSYNALSRDVFNYLFNAKMVWVYQANPHVKTALDFARDEWVRFMHNIHTPAPYGQGWTLLSLIPYWLGQNKFLPSWIIFRLLSMASVLLLIPLLFKLAGQLSIKLKLSDLGFVLLNPLFLIEIVSNSHNDLWMMLPAMWSFSLLLERQQEDGTKNLKLVWPALLFAFSVSIKFATLAILPIWLYLLIRAVKPGLTTKLLSFIPGLSNWLKLNWPLLVSLLMFLPLLTPRSKQFLPWYLTWSLIWLPLIKNKIWKMVLLAFSFSSLLRYFPWIAAGGYSQLVIRQQKIITWTIPLGALLYLLIYYLFEPDKHPNR